MVVDMSPLPLHLLFCYLATYTVTEGGIVRGIIGQNVSFTMTFHNINGDLIHIKHNASVFVEVWPDNNNHIEIKQQDRVRVEIGNKTASGSITVIINILNITASDSGMYNAMRPWILTEILDWVLLETTVTLIMH
ncbi:hypothetical protein CHS0354_025608 [Potamilus streckersoni]|uniref:Uncharacterized protein n=1 Tax=Potamilus streckersoni TaxID=2493646 RepID=A0AAE0S174_9BIVA|nr:hypothetical protein CHS0354_025608 [Potamilus streckersoni]